VLVDPEMVIATDERQIAAFCQQNKTRALLAMWERFSQTARLAEVTASGVVRRVNWLAGTPQEADQNPWAEFLAAPGARGIQAALVASGVPLAQAWGEISATVFELEA
jgi:hypothetical protein